jgi:hypothetical protein
MIGALLSAWLLVVPIADVHTGTATWYDAPSPQDAAAGPALRVGNWRGSWVIVRHGSDSVTVRLTDWCQCYGSRLIDLDDWAFASLAPLSQGVIDVTVEPVTLPATDTVAPASEGGTLPSVVNETVIVALIVSVIAPTLLAYLTGRQRRAEKREDWARQDKVAERVERVAKVAAAAQSANTATLHQIHTLVNSDMTAARTAELTTTRLLILSLKRQSPDDPTVADAITTAEARATELEQILADRLVAQRKVESDAAAVT